MAIVGAVSLGSVRSYSSISLVGAEGERHFVRGGILDVYAGVWVSRLTEKESNGSCTKMACCEGGDMACVYVSQALVAKNFIGLSSCGVANNSEGVYKARFNVAICSCVIFARDIRQNVVA